jgi:hypothetical protein
MSALLSFLGGSAFRAIWGEVASWVNKRQDHKFEQQRMLLQGKLDAEQHARNLAGIRVQAELGIKTIQVQADADAERAAGEAFREAMARAATPTGIRWVDAWNGCIRPAFGTLALVLILRHVHTAGWVMVGPIMEVVFAIVGFYFADRTLRKAGK